MTTERKYIPEPFRGPTLAGHIKMALEISVSVLEACSRIQRLLEASDVTMLDESGVLVPLPPFWKLHLPKSGGIVLRTADGGDLDPTKVFVRARTNEPDYSWVLERAALAAEDRQRTLAALARADAKEKPEQDAAAKEKEQPAPPPESAGAPVEPQQQPAPGPAPETDLARSRGGRVAEHDWEGAACYVEDRIKKAGHPLERDQNGKPVIQRGIDLMEVGFKMIKDPKPPKERYIREWINNHRERTSKWWNADN